MYLDRAGHGDGQPRGASMAGLDMLAVVELISVYDAVQVPLAERVDKATHDGQEHSPGGTWHGEVAGDRASRSQTHGPRMHAAAPAAMAAQHAIPAHPAPSLSASAPRPPKATPRTGPASHPHAARHYGLCRRDLATIAATDGVLVRAGCVEGGDRESHCNGKANKRRPCLARLGFLFGSVST